MRKIITEKDTHRIWAIELGNERRVKFYMRKMVGGWKVGARLKAGDEVKVMVEKCIPNPPTYLMVEEMTLRMTNLQKWA